METKKISFGFMKTKKVEKPVVEEKRDYIECVEEKSIKVIGGEEAVEKAPLVIPMKPNTLITAERLKEIAEKVEKSIEEPDPDEKAIKTEVKDEPQENETLDQMAIRELLEETKKEVKVERSELTVPVPAKPVMEGETESTLEDYESVPIQDFGMAMLRGMGWNPNKEQSKYKLPQLRPKGLGLGADKVISEQKKKSAKNKEEELSIVKNSYVKVVTGKYSGCYGKVVSLDEENGRVMVELAVKRETISLSEFMMQPVTKSEFNKESKVINADSFEEYKKSEKSQTSSRQDSPKVNESREASSSHKSNDVRENKRDKEENHRRDQDRSNGKGKDKSQRTRRDSSSSEDRSRSRKKEKKKYSSCESLSSLSDSDKKKKHKSSRKKYSSDNSDSYKKNRRRSKTPEGKRDIDKKRKGKKKKRDRDRSPNYKKHRK